MERIECRTDVSGEQSQCSFLRDSLGVNPMVDYTFDSNYTLALNVGVHFTFGINRCDSKIFVIDAKIFPLCVDPIALAI